MSSSTEYSKPSSGGAGCSYNTLCNYHSHGTMAPMSHKARTVTGSYVVPAYGAPGYATLTHGNAGGCSGYFSIQGAYGKGAGQCNQAYVTSLCGGCGQYGK